MSDPLPETGRVFRARRGDGNRRSALCVRCGQTLEAGARAAWDPSSKLVVHGARCPRVAPIPKPAIAAEPEAGAPRVAPEEVAA